MKELTHVMYSIANDNEISATANSLLEVWLTFEWPPRTGLRFLKQFEQPVAP